jgi:hypothetical protein
MPDQPYFSGSTSGVWSENPPVGIPGVGGTYPKNPWEAMMQQIAAARALGPKGQQREAEGSGARVGGAPPIQGPPLPTGATNPFGAPSPVLAQAGGAPGGGPAPTAGPSPSPQGGGVPASAPGSGPAGASGGYLPQGPFSPTSTALPQIPINPNQQYYTSGERKQANVANLISGFYNEIQNRKQQNEQRQFKMAENLYSQVLQAKAKLEKDPTDATAKAFLDQVLSNPKNIKMFEESLQVAFPKVTGGETEEPKKTPQSEGAKSAVQKFAQSLGQAARDVVDPRTQTQRMPQAQQQGQLPPPNTPGGVSFPYPQQTGQQKAEKAVEDATALLYKEHPELAMEKAKRDQGLIPSADVQAKQDVLKAHYNDVRAHWDQVNSTNVAKLEEVKRKDSLIYQAAEDRINAYIQAHPELGADSSTIADLAKRYQRSDIKLSDIPSKLRPAVIQSLGDTPIMRQLTTQQKQVWTSLGQVAPMLDDFSRSLNNFIAQNPGSENDVGMAGVENWAEAKTAWAEYSAGAEPEKARAELIKQAAALQVMSAAQWQTIGRSKYQYEIIIQHLPKPSDTPAMMRDKATFLSQVVADTRDSLQRARSGQDIPGPSGAPAPQLGIQNPRPDMIITPQDMGPR